MQPLSDSCIATHSLQDTYKDLGQILLIGKVPFSTRILKDNAKICKNNNELSGKTLGES